MSPDVTTDSFKTILDVGVVGAMCVLLMIVLVLRERYWQKFQKATTDTFTAEIKGERAAHDKTRDALLEEVRSNADTISLVRSQMQQQQSSFETLMKMIRKDAS